MVLPQTSPNFTSNMQCFKSYNYWKYKQQIYNPIWTEIILQVTYQEFYKTETAAQEQMISGYEEHI